MSARSTCRHEADTDAPCAGFTLVEMLVTLTILVLVMGSLTVSMARRDVVPTPHDKAREIQALLYLARSEAISTGEDRTVVINVDGRRLDYQARKPVILADGQKLRVVAGRELITGNNEVSLVFLADGGSSGADIEVSDGRGRSAMLRINWLTGLPALLGADKR
jgi:general secretion pathway protein H